MISRRRRGDAGQSTVELALGLPLVATLLLAVVQVGLLVRDQIVVVHAAREAARAAAVSDDPDAPRRAAAGSSGLDRGRLEVRRSGRGDPGSVVGVEVRYRSPMVVPLLSRVVDDVSLRADASMRVE